MLLTPPDPVSKPNNQHTSGNVIQLNTHQQSIQLLIYFDSKLAWNINRFTIPLFLIANILLFIQGRYVNSSTRLVDRIKYLIEKLNKLNYPARQIYSFVWLSFLIIYLIIVAVSWVTQFEFNVLEFAGYLIVLVLCGLLLLFFVKCLEISASLIKWCNNKLNAQFLGSVALLIGIPSTLALIYLLVAIGLSELFELQNLIGVSF